MATKLALNQSGMSAETISKLSKLHEKLESSNDNIKRLKVPLPDLSAAIDPNHPEIEKVLKNMKIFEVTRGGLSEATQRNLFSTLRSWCSYTTDIGLRYAFPINTQIFFYWFVHLQLEEHKSYATIVTRKNLFSIFFKLMDMPDATKERMIVERFKGLKRDMAKADLNKVTQRVAVPFRAQHLNALLPLMRDLEQTGLKNLRDLCVLIIAYCTGIREGEIGTILRKNISFSNGSITIKRVVSKTSSAPVEKSITNEYAEILNNYLAIVDNAIVLFNKAIDKEESNIEKMEEGVLKEMAKKKVPVRLTETNTYIFSWIYQNSMFKNGTTPMPGETIDRVFERAYKLLYTHDKNAIKHPDYGRIWTGHSGRVGACIDGKVIHNMSEADLMSIGDWTNMSTVMRYLRATGHLEASNIKLQGSLKSS
ncbi:site-specific integrase [Vibrio chagasii]|uniref:Site-specific integrase n=1 Tax=Vibrio chagasii TaxID=170679 RepID=A0A7V7NWZ7_9VIBR|nr:site-specific integrase [Vibrio chagasii]KAB0482450.1 site-specific integrase [Vibrio chagasii]